MNTYPTARPAWLPWDAPPFSAAPGRDRAPEPGVALRFISLAELTGSLDLWLAATSVGTDDPPSGSVQAQGRLRRPDGTCDEVAVDHERAGDGTHLFWIRGALAGAGSGRYELAVRLPDSTGGDSYQFAFELTED